MQNIFNVYKPAGLTPFEIVEAFKNKFPEYENKKVAYAGRLDPLAEGVLLLLVEPETKHAKKHQNLDKVYEFEILFGVETDTYDVLGKIVNSQESDGPIKISRRSLERTLEAFQGKRLQQYPPFSSKTVRGKPLYWWAREGKLGEIVIPRKKIEIFTVRLLKLYYVDSQILSHQVAEKINSVKGDFRQKEILNDWNKFLKESKIIQFPIAKVRVGCSSGTYVRSISHNVGKMLKVNGLAYSIKRLKVGKYDINNSIEL